MYIYGVIACITCNRDTKSWPGLLGLWSCFQLHLQCKTHLLHRACQKSSLGLRRHISMILSSENSSHSPLNGERSSGLYRMPSTHQWPSLWVFRHADLFHHPFLCGRIHYSRPKALTEEYYLLWRRIFFSCRARPAVTFYMNHPHSQIHMS